MFVGLYFLQNVPIGVYTLFTAWPQDQTSLDDTHVRMVNSITQQKQWPEAFESKLKTELGYLGNMSFQMVLFQLQMCHRIKNVHI